MGRLTNDAISLARKVWYSTYEPLRLRYERARDFWDGVQTCSLAPWRPLVSVYIPTHNRVDLLLTRALPSVLAQTYPNVEVIVAAHGCTDGTEERVRATEWLFAESPYPKVHVISVPRERTYPPTAENHWLAGPVVPANAALEVCRGEWIARIDDDDKWTPDHLSRLVAFALRGEYEFVSAAHETHEGKVAPYDVRGNRVGGTQTWLYRSYLRFFTYNPDCWRKRWNRVNDTDLQDRMAFAGVRMGYLDEVVAKVLPRPGERNVGLKAYRDKKHEIERRLAF